jgi:hypothetical protein
MKKVIYIHTNNKQKLGAKLAKYAMERYLTDKEIVVQILNVDELAPFKNFAGVEYKRKGKLIKYDPTDLQSFTLSRFMPPQLNGYEGRAMVIDPDIFALADVSEFFNQDMEGKKIACCIKKDARDSSVMLFDCAQMRDWSIEKILGMLKSKELDYSDIMELRVFTESDIKPVPRIYNNLDTLTDDTVLVHTTNRLTQPWSTGLKIDFTRNNPGSYFGIIPKIPILKLMGKWPSTYQPHPDPRVEQIFFNLLKEALTNHVVTKSELEEEVEKNRLRKDIFEKIK